MARIAPTITFDPPCSDLRVTVRRWPGGGAVFVFNEGQDVYHGTASATLAGKLHEIELATGLVRAVNVASPSDSRQTIPLTLDGWQSMLLIACPHDVPVASPTAHKVLQSVDLADDWTARVDRQYVAGEHDYEIRQSPQPEFKPAALGCWAEKLGLGADFSGHVTYRRKVNVPESLRGGRLLLDLGDVEYAARVSVDGQKLGCVLWSPWRIELSPLNDRCEFVLEITVSNTLANEITSRRVREAWGERKGPGWPSPYHKRALQFEMDSRGGGLLGPVRLQRATP